MTRLAKLERISAAAQVLVSEGLDNEGMPGTWAFAELRSAVEALHEPQDARTNWYPIECEHGYDACPICDTGQ